MTNDLDKEIVAGLIGAAAELLVAGIGAVLVQYFLSSAAHGAFHSAACMPLAYFS
jgi:hypothetical protein